MLLKHPAIHRTSPTKKNYLAANNAEVEKLWVRGCSVSLCNYLISAWRLEQHGVVVWFQVFIF